MKKLCSALALLLGVLCALPAHAAGSGNSIAAGLGDYDFDKGGSRQTADYRLEYQWGKSLLPLAAPSLNSYDRWFQIHPVAGLEGDGNGMLFLNGGLNLDVPVVSHIMFTWGETAGLYEHGDDKQTLGSPFEVRSQIELGWRFENDMRLSAYLSHLSNLGIGDRDPGAEVLGAYLRLPTSWLAHR